MLLIFGFPGGVSERMIKAGKDWPKLQNTIRATHFLIIK